MARRHDRTFSAALFGVEVIETSRYPFVRRLATDPTSVVVAVHGGCRFNGQFGTRGGYGVFFGQECTLNRSGRVKIMSKQTHQYAEIHAAFVALETCHNLILEGEDIKRIVLRCSSGNLWMGLTEWVWQWQQRGWRRTTGGNVANPRAWKSLQRKALLLEDKFGVLVNVCLVPKDLNESAVALSTTALEIGRQESIVQPVNLQHHVRPAGSVSRSVRRRKLKRALREAKDGAESRLNGTEPVNEHDALSYFSYGETIMPWTDAGKDVDDDMSYRSGEDTVRTGIVRNVQHEERDDENYDGLEQLGTGSWAQGKESQYESVSRGFGDIDTTVRPEAHKYYNNNEASWEKMNARSEIDEQPPRYALKSDHHSLGESRSTYRNREHQDQDSSRSKYITPPSYNDSFQEDRNRNDHYDARSHDRSSLSRNRTTHDSHNSYERSDRSSRTYESYRPAERRQEHRIKENSREYRPAERQHQEHQGYDSYRPPPRQSREESTYDSYRPEQRSRQSRAQDAQLQAFPATVVEKATRLESPRQEKETLSHIAVIELTDDGEPVYW